jgi:hypothetical protein
MYLLVYLEELVLSYNEVNGGQFTTGYLKELRVEDR